MNSILITVGNYATNCADTKEGERHWINKYLCNHLGLLYVLGYYTGHYFFFRDFTNICLFLRFKSKTNMNMKIQEKKIISQIISQDC